MLVGGIEGGGTKFVCGVSNEDLQIIDQTSILTRDPQETLSDIFAFFNQYSIESLGVGSFGPIDIDEYSDTYGYITTTPKQKWKNFNFLESLKQNLKIPIGWTTDVNAAAYGEFSKGAARNTSSCLYLTVGTGIGGGAIINNKILESFSHPEMGHIHLKRHPDDSFEGICSYHNDCLEGLASGPSIEARYGVNSIKLPEKHVGWDIEAYYLGQALVNYFLTLMPEKIIIGGGVMNQPHLLVKVQDEFKKQLNNYISISDIENYIVTPGLGNNAGLIGSLTIGKDLI